MIALNSKFMVKNDAEDSILNSACALNESVSLDLF